MALPVQDFTITPAAFEKLKQQAAGAGFTITMNAGQAIYRGCTIAWDYDPGMARYQCSVSTSPGMFHPVL